MMSWQSLLLTLSRRLSPFSWYLASFFVRHLSKEERKRACAHLTCSLLYEFERINFFVKPTDSYIIFPIEVGDVCDVTRTLSM